MTISAVFTVRARGLKCQKHFFKLIWKTFEKYIQYHESTLHSQLIPRHTVRRHKESQLYAPKNGCKVVALERRDVERPDMLRTGHQYEWIAVGLWNIPKYEAKNCETLRETRCQTDIYRCSLSIDAPSCRGLRRIGTATKSKKCHVKRRKKPKNWRDTCHCENTLKIYRMYQSHGQKMTSTKFRTYFGSTRRRQSHRKVAQNFGKIFSGEEHTQIMRIK